MQDKHISSFLQIINIPISAIKLHKKKKSAPEGSLTFLFPCTYSKHNYLGEDKYNRW